MVSFYANLNWRKGRMKAETKLFIQLLGIIILLAIFLSIAIFKFSDIDNEQKNEACREIGYKKYMSDGYDNYCLISDNVGIKVIMFQKIVDVGKGYNAVEIRGVN